VNSEVTSTINLDNIVRSVALISDTHVWSDYGLVSRTPVYDKKNAMINPPERLNPGQKDIQSCWYDKFIPTAKAFNVDMIIHFGDALQGCNPKEGGIDLLHPNIDFQKEDFVNLMKPLVKGRKYIQMSGTTYHEVLNTRIHKDLVDKLKPYCREAIFGGKFANIHLEETEKLLNCAHAATSALIYPANVIDRELVFIKVAVAEGRIPMPNYLIRGHLHKYIHLDYVDIHGVQLPGWMAWYPLGDKVRLYGRTQPDIGWVLLLVDKLNRSILLHFVYPTPNIIDFVRSE